MASYDLKLAFSKAIVNAYLYSTNHSEAGSKVAKENTGVNKAFHNSSVRIGNKVEEDLFVNMFDIQRWLQAIGSGSESCKLQFTDITKDILIKISEHLNHSFCPGSETFSRFTVTLDPCGGLAACLRRTYLFGTSIRNALSKSNSFEFGSSYESTKSVSMFVHCFSELMSGSTARSEVLAMSVAAILTQTGCRATVCFPQDYNLLFKYKNMLPLRRIGPGRLERCSILPDIVDGTQFLERDHKQSAGCQSPSVKLDCNMKAIKVRLSDDSLTAEARCAAAIASSMEPKEVFLLHVLDQRRVLFIEKCILLATCMRGPGAIGEMSWHHVATHSGLKNIITGTSEMQFEDLFESRRKQVQKAFAIKYGDEIRGANFENLVSCMADGTLKFELLAVDPKNQVKAFQEDVNDVFHKSSGCFVLYNCARIITILKKFEKSVNEGLYPPLPSLEEVDFSLLKDEKEWNLSFKHLMQFPVLLDEVVENIVSRSHFTALNIRKLCQFLSSLSSEFSAYYSKVRILMEPQPHLFSLIHARIYLLMGLKEVMYKGLELLGIEPIHQI